MASPQNGHTILTDRPPLSDSTRALLSLPSRLGGISLYALKQCSYAAFVKVTASLTEAISHQDSDYTIDIMSAQISAKQEVHAYA